MRKSFAALTALGLVLAFTATAEANTRVKLGSASGGLMIYYNNLDVSGAAGVPDGVISGYDETLSNQAYVQAQYGYSNTNGMRFQFDTADLGGGVTWNDIFSGQPAGSSQFGLDILAVAPTYNPAGGVTIPQVDFADNVDNTVGGASLTTVIPPGSMAWAINDYKGSAPSGPQEAGNSIINSVFRGLSWTFTDVVVTPPAGAGDTTWELDVEGELLTDGLIHWYNPPFATTDLTSWLLGDKLYFEGTLSYDTNYSNWPWGTPENTYGDDIGDLENGSDQRDFYQGELEVYAEVIPEPLTMAGLVMGVGGLFAYVRRRRSA